MFTNWLNYRTGLGAWGLACAMALGACSDRSDVAAPHPTAKAKPTGSVAISSPAITLLSVELSGGELPQTLLYDLPMNSTESAQSLSIPSGAGYAAIVRGYDRNGNLTHQGNLQLDRVAVGPNGRLDLALESVREGDALKVSMDLIGEAPVDGSYRIVIRADRRAIYDGETVSLRADVYNSLGQPVSVDPSEIHWAIGDPRTGLVIPKQTREAAMASYTGRYLWDMNYGILIAQLGRIRADIKQLLMADPWVDLSAGGAATCAVRQSGRLYCWGDNNFAMLGTSQDSACTGYNDRCTSAPVLVQGGHQFSRVSVGQTHVCALEYFTSAPFCWGQNLFGEVGVATVAIFSSPTQVSGNPSAYMSISAGWSHTCGVTAAFVAMCWGENQSAQLGTGVVGNTSTPTAVAAPLNSGQVSYASVSAGFLHSCGITTTSKIFCWGSLGGATSSIPVEKTNPFSQSWASLGEGPTAQHVCATTSTNVAWCWGDNTSGQLGNGSGGAGFKSSAPVGVLSGGVSFVATSTGYLHSCALTSTSDAYCWGEAYNGELGNGSQVWSKTPVQVLSGGVKFSKIAVGDSHACAIDYAGNDIYCWGANSWGQLGLGTRNTILDPKFGANGVAYPTKIVAPLP